MPIKTITKRWIGGTGAVLILIIIAGNYVYTHYARENFSYALRATPQNALEWLDPKTENIPILTPAQEQQSAERYLQHYFAPWSQNYLQYFPVLTNPVSDVRQLKTTLQQKIDLYQEKPGWGINHLPNSKQWIEEIASNMDLEHFPNANLRVITLVNTNMRVLPTQQPSFGNLHEAGEGYPFDYLQATTIAPNIPALVIQKTHDGLWSLIITNNSFGWVLTTALALVDDEFIRQWQTGHYVTLTKNNIPIKDNHGLVRFSADIGKIFPSTSTTSSDKFYPILIAVADGDQRAIIKTGQLDQQNAAPWPIQATPRNVATIMNQMLHVKYGWGGITGDCDCSFTTMDLFSTFGIWLPRNSSEQVLAGHSIDLMNLSNKEKVKTIVSQGVPFLTLLHMPHHITVYIGQKNNKPYLFQTAWGIHTKNFLRQDGRAIIGDTVITPIDLGKNDLNVTNTWLDKIDQMILFTALPR